MSIPNFATIGDDDGNSYVAQMTHSHHIDINGETTIHIAASVVDGTELLASTALGAAATIDNLAIIVNEAFGRTLAFTSADADGTFTVHGRDFLGQLMTEDITASSGTATGAKAFKYVDKVVSDTNDGAIEINTGAGYGLPYCAVEIVREVVDGVAATEGTITAAVTTTPSATTGDVRGTYNPNTAGDGAKDFDVTYVTTNQLTGGLYGQPQA